MAASKTGRPLRLVLAGVGSRGDVQPMIALAQAAAARGHHPVVAVPVNFESWVRECGLEFTPLGQDMQQFLADNPGLLTGNPLSLGRIFREASRTQTPLQVRQLCEVCQDADALLWGGVALIAPSVAEWARIPSLGVIYSTCMVPSGQHPPPLIHWYGLPSWMNRLLWWVNDWLGERVMGIGIHPARASLGLPALSLRELLFERGDYAIAADAEIFPDDPQWDPQRFVRASSIFFDDTRALDAELDAWLRDGEPPVFAGFGSMSGPAPIRAARAFVDALAASGRRCLIGSGWAGLDGLQLPPGWRVVGDVPHAQLFPRLALVIHHGGSGTTATALRAGTPQVLLPLLLDQYHHAHLLHRAGLAPRPVPMERITGASLATCIAEALALPHGPREAAAARLRASDGIATILDVVEARAARSGANALAGPA